MSNIERFLQQQQGFAQARAAMGSQFNTDPLNKQLQSLKAQSLESAKNITRQLVGQETLETIMAAPMIGKTALGLVKTGARFAKDPAGFASAVKQAGRDKLNSLYKGATGRDLPANTEEARQQVVDEAKNQFRNATGRELPDSAEEAESQVRGMAQRFVRPPGDEVELTSDFLTGTRAPARAPFFEAPPSRVPQPGDVEFRAFQEQQRALAEPNLPAGEVQQVGGFRLDDPGRPDTIPSDTFDFKAPTEEQFQAERTGQRVSDFLGDIESRNVAGRVATTAAEDAESGGFLPGMLPGTLRAPELGEQLSNVTLKPATTRFVRPRQRIQEALEQERVEPGRIPVSRAREPLTPSQAREAGFRPPDTPRPEPVREPEPEAPEPEPEAPAPQAPAAVAEPEPVAPTLDAPASYVRPGTNYRVNANAPEEIESQASRNPFEVNQQLADVRARAEGTSDDILSTFERRAGQRFADIDARAAARRARAEADRARLSELTEREPEIPDFPTPPTGQSAARGGDVPSTARGEETDSSLQQRLDNLRRPAPAEPEEEEGRVPPNQAEPEPHPLAEENNADLDEFGLPKAPEQSGSAADFMGEIESKGESVAAQVAKTAVKELPEELTAEAPLDAIPGLGELVMAGTLIGSLFHARHEAKEAEAQKPTPPPQTPQAPKPFISFDSAPTLDTSSYHNA